jgi:hypothetical protein
MHYEKLRRPQGGIDNAKVDHHCRELEAAKGCFSKESAARAKKLDLDTHGSRACRDDLPPPRIFLIVDTGEGHESQTASDS